MELSLELENILKEMVEIKDQTISNMEEYVQDTTNSKSLKESLYMEDETEEEPDVEVEIENDFEEDMVGDTDDDESSQELEGEGDDEMEADMESEVDAEMDDDPYKDYYDEDGNVDLVNLSETDPEAVANLISMAPEGTTFVKVSRPALEVTTPSETDFSEDDETEVENDFESMEEQQMVESADEDSNDEELMNEEEVDKDQYKLMENKLKIYETKLRKLQGLLKQSTDEVKTLKENYQTSLDVLKKSKQIIIEQHLVNTNLKHVSKLFTEHSVNVDKRKKILEDFSGLNKVEESKVMYTMWERTLSDSDKKPLKESMIASGVTVKVDNTEKNGIVTESVNKLTTNKNTDDYFMRMSGIKK